MVTAVIFMFGVSSVGVSAEAPPVVHTLSFVATNNVDGTSYAYITFDNTAFLKGWCVQPGTDITFGQTYQADVYDYFGIYYPDHLDALPASFSTPDWQVKWHEIAFLLNNVPAGANWMDEQFAIWAIVTGDIPDADALPLSYSMYQDAITNGQTFVPSENNQLKPVICYGYDNSHNLVQLMFFEYQNITPVPPLPELPAGVLLGVGLAALGGFVIIKKRHQTISVN